jgi:hypothetical protein
MTLLNLHVSYSVEWYDNYVRWNEKGVKGSGGGLIQVSVLEFTKSNLGRRLKNSEYPTSEPEIRICDLTVRGRTANILS